MTIETADDSVKRYIWDGITTEFTYPRIMDGEDLFASLYLDSGVKVQDITQDKYELSDLFDTGILTITDAGTLAVIADKIVLERIEPLTQQLDLDKRDFPPEDVEREFDKSVLIDQQIQSQMNRSVVSNILDERETPYVLPIAEVGKVLGWTSDNELGNLTTEESGEVFPAIASTYLKRSSANDIYEAKTVGEVRTDLGLDDKADKSNVLELDNTDAFTPDEDYEPATKKYVDDSAPTVTYNKGHLQGTISNNASNPDEIIDTSIIEARSADDTTDITLTATTLDITSGTDYASGTLPKTLQDLFVAMTSNTAPSPEECWATSAIRQPWLALNKTNTSGSDSFSSSIDPTAGVPQICLRAMTATDDITRIDLTARNDGSFPEYMVDYLLVYTSDDMSSYGNVDDTIRSVSFTTVKTITGDSYTADQTKSFTLDSVIPSTATAWGISCTDFAGGGNWSLGKMEGLGLAPSLNNAETHVWADDNNGSPRAIFDDITGSNLLDADKAAYIDPVWTDGSGDIYAIDIKGEGKTQNYLFNALDTHTTTGVKTIKALPNSLLIGYTTGTVKNLVDNNTYPEVTDLVQADENMQIENISGNTYIKGFRVDR